MPLLAEMNPLEMYDLVYAEAKRLGRKTQFLKKFGTRQEYAKRVGMEAQA